MFDGQANRQSHREKNGSKTHSSKDMEARNPNISPVQSPSKGILQGYGTGESSPVIDEGQQPQIGEEIGTQK